MVLARPGSQPAGQPGLPPKVSKPYLQQLNNHMVALFYFRTKAPRSKFFCASTAVLSARCSNIADFVAIVFLKQLGALMDSWGPHGVPMEDPMGSHGSSWAPWGVQWSHEVPMGSHAPPPWGLHGGPMGSHGSPMGSPWGPLVPHGFPWGPHRFPSPPWVARAPGNHINKLLFWSSR